MDRKSHSNKMIETLLIAVAIMLFWIGNKIENSKVEVSDSGHLKIVAELQQLNVVLCDIRDSLNKMEVELTELKQDADNSSIRNEVINCVSVEREIEGEISNLRQAVESIEASISQLEQHVEQIAAASRKPTFQWNENSDDLHPETEQKKGEES
jgi:uncharacterized protein YhaN